MDRWTWSDEMYDLHGFKPHEVVPTTGLVLTHTHPDDRETVRETLSRAGRAGKPFSSVHRILTATERERTVTVVGRPRKATSDSDPLALVGYFVDLTSAVAERVRESALADIRAAAETRGVIEQAKGVLAVLYDMGTDPAFELMRKASNDHNVAVRDLARQIVDLAHRPEIDRKATAARLLGGPPA
ncbi:PAS and ANTAR domain-containing protein [Isoptericola sp. NPDC057191]|uniref:PAS and ANTAR domain-containing protein n=1 Tax=Isoptericola sp. NPDC057191 TaxID=3346041 RepID=UPI00363487F6